MSSDPKGPEPTPLTARLRRAHRKCVNCDRLANTVPDWEHCHGHKVALAYSDCPIASLLAEIEGYRQALDIDHIEIVISQELRRLYVGQLDALHVAEQHREAVEACFLCAVKKPPFDAAVRQAARVLAGKKGEQP